jgi:broad specificity phosphatase PhoE
MTEKETEILNLIESSIKKGNKDIESFFIALHSSITKIISIKNLKKMIKKRIIGKNIYFIRHAEAMHNVLEQKYNGDFSKCNVYDPVLSEQGKKQTQLTIDKLKKENIKFDTVFVSPLTRTIQTYFLIKDYINKDAQVIITDFAKEIVSYCDKNKGKKLSLLKSEYKDYNFNFDYMTKEYWWFDLGKQKDGEYENDLLFGSRLRIFMLWLFFRPEKNILIISHSHVFAELQDYGIYNADLAKMDNHILSKKIQELFN